MKTIALLSALLSSLIFTPSSFGAGTCTGAFPNIITDICWDCVFPVSFAGGVLSIGVSGSDYDTGVSPSPVCICTNTLSAGTPMSFWEPRYMVDVTNIPGCFPLLGGMSISPPYNASEYGAVNVNNSAIGGSSKSAFMHANEYLNPILSAAGIIAASPCLDNRSFDVPYISWADPTWGDDSLALILTPYAYAFTGLASIAAEAPDAIQATFGFPNQYLFWVAGAWGPMYPLTGNVSTANTPEQVSHLLLARIFAKLHAAGVEQSTAGQAALDACTAFGVPELIMDKRQYKTNRTWPFPDNMCTPIGRPLQLQEIGAARPTDKDYGYIVFQRKDCCQPLVTP
jgi:conjugal transfer pilus assembly protein TraU